MQCRSHASQLGRLYPDFRAEGCQVLLILGGTTAEAHRYAETLHLPFPVLSDPERRIYQLYGLDKFMQLVQRTASLVIDWHGVIRYEKFALNPFVWLQESRELLAFVKSLAAENQGNP